jgi:hypothetical protein
MGAGAAELEVGAGAADLAATGLAGAGCVGVAGFAAPAGAAACQLDAEITGVNGCATIAAATSAAMTDRDKALG